MTVAEKELREQKQYLTFLLGDEECAINILKVKEIIEYAAVTAVPKAPTWARGVINLRGAVVPVVDLAAKFGLEQKPVSKTTCIVIVETRFEDQPVMMGVIADAVSQVVELSEEDIRPAPDFGTRVRMDYLLGMAQLDRKLALLLDVDKVLTIEELYGLSEVSARTQSTAAEKSEGWLAIPPTKGGEDQGLPEE
jgi:purine-binding chemotaxis protein CheW